MKFIKDCFVIGFGIGIGRLGYHVAGYVTAKPIAKMAESLGKSGMKLNEIIDNLEKAKKQKEWREAVEARKENQNDK